MTAFNEKKFSDPENAAEFIVAKHNNGETVTVANGDKYSSPNMHSCDDYQVATRPDGTVGVQVVGNSFVWPTPAGTTVLYSGNSE